MKRLLGIVYYLGVLIVPLTVFYFNVDNYLVTATESSIEYLKEFLVKLVTEDSEGSIEFKKMFIYMVLVGVFYKVTSKFIFDRKLGLSLKERKGDWIITLWQVSINVVIWIILYKTMSFFNINTGAWLESFNVIIIFVVIGNLAKLYSTFLHYMENLGIKKK